MDWQLIGLCFVIQLIGTLAYVVRIAGVRTRRIAVSFALFNVLVLVSRTSNSFQGPFLTSPRSRRPLLALPTSATVVHSSGMQE
jgi:Alternate to MurJ